MKLWLVRHPQPDVPAGLCYGATDVPIVESHLAELLDALPARLPRHAALYSSPLSRCLRLAQGLQTRGFDTPTTDPRLREMDFGHWEGRPWADLPREQVDAWRADIAHHVPPGGESLATLAARGMSFVNALPHDREAILVTHVGVILALLRTLRGLPLAPVGKRQVAYGETLVLQHEGGAWRLLEDDGPGVGDLPPQVSPP